LGALSQQTKFIIDADQKRVWDLFGRAIFDSLGGMGKMKVLDENNFRAELKMNIFGIIPVTFYVRGEMIDITPPSSLAVNLKTASKWDIITMLLKITFIMSPLGNNKTEVLCSSVAEGIHPALQWAAKGQVKSQSKDIFTKIEQRLKQWV
jgi:hypothetical protein